jgi:hypothetical protein
VDHDRFFGHAASLFKHKRRVTIKGENDVNLLTVNAQLQRTRVEDGRVSGRNCPRVFRDTDPDYTKYNSEF